MIFLAAMADDRWMGSMKMLAASEPEMPENLDSMEAMEKLRVGKVGRVEEEEESAGDLYSRAGPDHACSYLGEGQRR